MRKINFKEQGITLMSLVITIVILLILAGVTIGTISGNEGLIAKARKSANTYQEFEIDETHKISELSNLLDDNKFKLEYDSDDDGNKVEDSTYKSIRWKRPIILYGENADEEITGGWTGSFIAYDGQLTYAITNNQLYLEKGDIVSAIFTIYGDNMYEDSGTLGISSNGSTADLVQSQYIRNSVVSTTKFSAGIIVEESGYYNVVVKMIGNYRQCYSQTNLVQIF